MKVPPVLAKAQITCSIWGYDAAMFTRDPDGFLFQGDLHLLVTDSEVQAAAEALNTSFPDLQPLVGDPYDALGDVEHTMVFNPEEPPMFPDSIYLQSADHLVFFHPQSQFYFDIEDYTRSFVLQPFPETIRFPTRAAMFDSYIEVVSDPPSGRDLRGLEQLLNVSWMSDLFKKGQQVLFRNDPLDAECLEIMESLRPENRPYFEVMMRKGISTKKLFKTRPKRKEILHRLGRHEEAQRPLPLPFADKSNTYPLRLALDFMRERQCFRL